MREEKFWSSNWKNEVERMELKQMAGRFATLCTVITDIAANVNMKMCLLVFKTRG